MLTVVCPSFICLPIILTHVAWAFIDITYSAQDWMLCGKNMNFGVRETEIQSLALPLPSLLVL